MSEIEKLEKGFLDAIVILKDVLPQMVIVGGWCPYLYAHYLWQRRIPNIPTTLDIDLGVVETGNKQFDKTVYERLKLAGFTLEKLYPEEDIPVEFVYKKKAIELKLEFITSFETSDDTLNHFLGSQLACNRIEAFELLLKHTAMVSVRTGKETLDLKIPTPEIFLYHKGITFTMRSEDFKRDKDLFYVYFILKFHPDRQKLFQVLEDLRKDDYFRTFKENAKEYLLDVSRPGYLILRPFLRAWIAEKDINKEIEETFSGLFQLIAK